MKLATIRTADGTAAVRLDGDRAVETGAPDVAALLRRPDWRAHAAAVEGPAHDVAALDLAPVVTTPTKIFCVGHNYRAHIAEMGREMPSYPALFGKFANVLLGARDDIVHPGETEELDWEAELGFVIGSRLRRRATKEEAAAAIAGYTVVNDISMRDWQWRTPQWLQGKAWEASTPAGPWLVTGDEIDDAADLEIRLEVDGQVMQRSRTSDLLFTPADIAAYLSTFTTLEPGDLVLTGTPGGVGAARDPKVFLKPGQVVRTVVEGIGECVNTVVEDKT
ncbi:fumarylacetoacetate hydrolase family protein [Streptomyces sp. ME02-8801-2C]|uniref:fumarylacetoacetate hydrolase family protein n=1 Tax=Streptomyces sp. ME02-8801-2C TaxID=3028680 RepID=UPI0029B8BBCC|nr:fumarylacetoacetate hydrolase family protein [Streptomyces sp. ME02-8801-2C]MDX3458846.1 fumarylacetoacetate hydrolase family protein [Streptomyces sp. ME02-8801-2C]